MIVEIQCLPDPVGRDADTYAHVEAAIAVASASGCRMEVGALGTTIEGDPDALWPLLRAMHEATLAAGAASVVTVVKVAQHADADRAPTVDELTGKFRA